MISILIKADSRYPVARKKLKEVVRRLLKRQGIVKNAQVSLAVVGDRQMRQLNRKYREIAKTTSVLAFPLEIEGGRFVSPPDGILRLGDIVISYPVARKQAAEEGILVDEKIAQLTAHGLKHLLGISEDGFLS
jgi:probable rRNA maturation factor